MVLLCTYFATRIPIRDVNQICFEVPLRITVVNFYICAEWRFNFITNSSKYNKFDF